jgi:Myb-like DNA-binding domain
MGEIQSRIADTDRDWTGLTSVGEEEASEDGSSELPPNAASQQLNDELEHEGMPESPNDHDVSGDTLLPADSDAEAGEIDAFSMAESLPDLQRASAKLLEFFAASFSSPSHFADLARELANPKSAKTKKLLYLSNNLSSQKGYFGQEVYLSVEKIAAIFPPVDSSSKTWRVDGIIYKANCAQFALEILTRIAMTSEAEESMYELEGKFPLPFLNALVGGNTVESAGKSGLRRPTLDLALEARTQFLKTRLLSQNDQDPNAILHDVFFNENLDSQAGVDAASLLRGFNLPGFLQDDDGNLPEKYLEDVEERVREIRACFKEQGQDVSSALEERFPWEEFIFSVAKWLRSRNDELNRHLDQQPSVDDIRAELEDALSRSEKFDSVQETQLASQEEQASQQRPRELLPPAEIQDRRQAGERKSFSDMDSLVAFARLKKQFNSGNAKAPPRHSDFGPRLSKLASKPTGRTSLPVTPASSRQPARLRGPEVSAPPAPAIDSGDIDGEFEPDHQRVARPSQPRRTLAPNQRFSLPSQSGVRQHGIAPGFIDRQANASRVSPIDSQRLASGGPSSSRKRTRDVSFEDEDEDEDEDGEFETDNRRLDLQDRRGQKPAQNAKRPRYDYEADGRQEAPNETQLIARPGPGAPVPRPSNSSPQKPPQIRRPWTKEEDGRFISLIEQHGTSWAEIKSQDEASGDPKLKNRDQGALKDRARNLVMIMLK